MSAFADSFYWIALASPRDAWHEEVVRWANSNASERLVTTQEVLSEFLTWFSGGDMRGREFAASTVRTILADSSTQVLPQSTTGFHAALDLYEARLDKKYSLTDCRSMTVMRELGIARALTNDRHFSQEGFQIVFP